MSLSVDKVRCQKCLAVNPLTEKLCARCGTTLMIVVAPATLRFESESLDAVAHEEILLERVSILENRLARITERLEQSLGLLLRHARNSYSDHMMLHTLIAIMSEAGTINTEEFERLWRERCDSGQSGGKEKSNELSEM